MSDVDDIMTASKILRKKFIDVIKFPMGWSNVSIQNLMQPTQGTTIYGTRPKEKKIYTI